MELSGEVEEVGNDVAKFKPGDQVFAATGFGGGYAEYKCMPEKEILKNGTMLAKKPANISFEEAAAVPVGGLTALAFLRKANIQKDQKVLIYGASGSVGSYAVQLAKNFGGQVTGVWGATNLDLVKTLGADKVIDYAKEDFIKDDQTYDVIFDAVGKISEAHSKRSLRKNGIYLSTWKSTKLESGDLAFLGRLVESGKLRAVIDRCFP
jgi:NADPH:quinone reductase-like Zn-dependent oxidoreductase